MKLTLKDIKEHKEDFSKAKISLPKYDVDKVKEKTLQDPVWMHMGAGNIYHAFIASACQRLLNHKDLETGIITLSTRSAETRDRIEIPHDHLELDVTLLPDGSTKMEVLAATVADLLINGEDKADEEKCRQLFAKQSLKMLSFTITEKGYALKGLDGKFLPQVEADFKNGPDSAKHGMSITCALMYARYLGGQHPLALVAMDNCSRNGDKLKDSVLTIARKWVENGFCEKGFVDYLEDEHKVSFPCTMIDKITPRPDEKICTSLKEMGFTDMDGFKTSKGTFIAPFVNAEEPEYLVVEDCFPNGRPPLEKAGVLFTDKKGVDLCERMKVTTCLNPLHTALAVYGCILGYQKIFEEMADPLLVKLVKTLGYDEGLKVVDDPKILNPRDFLTEVIEKRLVNSALPDTPQRIATDSSLKVPVRFGETLKSYKRLGLDTRGLIAIPLAISGWLRYLLALDDNLEKIELSDDPQLPELKKHLSQIEIGHTENVSEVLHPILANDLLFGISLYEAGIGETVENMFKEEIKGKGAVRATLQKYL